MVPAPLFTMEACGDAVDENAWSLVAFRFFAKQLILYIMCNDGLPYLWELL